MYSEGTAYIVRLHTNNNSDQDGLNVGDTLKVIEVLENGSYIAKVTQKAQPSERRHIYGLSTFGSQAQKLKIAFDDLVNTEKNESQSTDKTNPAASSDKLQPNSITNSKPQNKFLSQSADFLTTSKSSSKQEELKHTETQKPKAMTFDEFGKKEEIAIQGVALSTSPTNKFQKAEIPPKKREVRALSLRQNEHRRSEEVNLQVFFKDGTYKILSAKNQTTVNEILCMLVEQMDERIRSLKEHFVLHEVSLNGQDNREMGKDEQPVKIMKGWESKTSRRFVASIKNKRDSQILPKKSSHKSLDPEKAQEFDKLLNNLKMLANGREAINNNAIEEFSTAELEELLSNIILPN